MNTIDPIFLKRFFTDKIYVIQDEKDASSHDFEAVLLEETAAESHATTWINTDHVGDIPEEEKIFLDKILDACRLNKDQVLSKKEMVRTINDLPDRINDLNVQTVILFQTNPLLDEFGKGIKLYHALDLLGAKVVLADPLNKIMQDNGLKRNLWEVLKLVFQVSV